MSKTSNLNHLRDEKSAYLKQHKTNPVAWHPYGPEVMQLAKDQNKPIFLSIGYSSCHWCHVMSEESFEDEAIANLLNENFVCIKVDKEELPDLDTYFQLASQVMNGRGGWPLNAFLTPEMKPYFVGTYFPKVAQEGMPSFTEVIQNLGKAFKEDKETIKKNSDQIIETISLPPSVEQKVEFQGHYPGAASVLNAIKEYQDDEFGGYGVDPKFPHFPFMEWAVEHMLEGMVPEEFGNHIIKSIEQMLMGGVYDHVRGGVHRYSVSTNWNTPHFEKMGYDQAGLLRLLSKVSLIYPSPLVFDAMIQTIDYLNNELLSGEGFFFSGQDSDSEGMEGLYFTFTRNEFIDALNDHDEKLIDQRDKYLSWFNITEAGNFKQGLNVISLNNEHKEEIFTPEGWNEVREVQVALLEARKMRIPPATDCKGVASWNFQILSSLMDVIQYCKIESIQNAAASLLQKSTEGIHKAFIAQDESEKTFINTSTTRHGHVPLFENYVNFADYSFRNYELTGASVALDNALQTMKFIAQDFYKEGVFYTRSIRFHDNLDYANIHTPIFDQSYKCSLATFIANLRKWSLVDTDLKEFLTEIEPTIETLTHLSLQNPLAFGECLRALVYPMEAYRKIVVPFFWIKNKVFQQFYTNFSSRFTLVYHENENEKWEIHTSTEVELNGEGAEEFKNVFTGPEETQERNE